MRKVLFFAISAFSLVMAVISVRQSVEVTVSTVTPGPDGLPDDSESAGDDVMTLTMDNATGSYAPTVTSGGILSDESSPEQHPLVENFSANTLGHIVSYADWLMMTDAGALRPDTLQRLEDEFRTLPVDAANQQQMQRYLLGLRYYRALGNRARESFPQRVERYDQLQNMMMDVDPDADLERLLNQLFDSEERDRARHYLRLLQH